jgi:hypothetical protein
MSIENYQFKVINLSKGTGTLRQSLKQKEMFIFFNYQQSAVCYFLKKSDTTSDGGKMQDTYNPVI